MFQRARLTLTLWYILIASAITLVFSMLAYTALRFELERGLQHQRVFFQKQLLPHETGPKIIVRPFDEAIATELRRDLFVRILSFDGFIILLAAIGGYILAGRTLRPIQNMVDEQNRFITDASHELRTPLTALRTEMEATLLDKNLTQKESHALIKSNLEEVINLQKLTDNLLELARFSKLNNHKAVFDVLLIDTVNEALKKVLPLAKKKSIVIHQEIKEAKLKGNPQQFVELFVILLDNAIKYSPSKSEITLTSKKTSNTVTFSIKDQGIGISEEDLQHIFDRFYRSDKSRTKAKTSGYGLGLAIAKQIVEEHQGTINVESTEGKGTKVIVSLPTKKF